MCGGIQGKIGKELIRGFEQSIAGEFLSGPDLPAEPSAAQLETEAAKKAKETETERRRRIAAGGRESTILASRQANQLDNAKKTLLGQ